MALRANLRLRFDKVAMRVVGALQGTLAEIVPEREAVLFTITAPIRLPARTIAAIETIARGSLAGLQTSNMVNGNDVCLRWIKGVKAHMPKAIGFVHNRGSSAELLLDLAEARLTGVEGLHRQHD